MAENDVKRVIPKSHLYKAAICWENWTETCYNYERMQGLAFAHAMTPIVNDLYVGDPDADAKRQDVIKRNSEFFNTENEFAELILGAVVALEEQKSLGEPIPNELITGFKTSLMGPLAGVGDTLWQGVLCPILLAICIDITLGGTIMGAIAFMIIMIAACYGVSTAFFMFSYKKGGDYILDLIEAGVLDKILLGAKIMGCMVMGGLIANYVSMTCGVEIITENVTFSLQESLFDAVMPNILPLSFTLIIYYLMAKKGWKSIKCIALIVVIGLICGLLGILV